jgi:hypothetical protein
VKRRYCFPTLLQHAPLPAYQLHNGQLLKRR